MLNVSISFVLLLNSPVILERVDYEIQMTECIRGELCQPLCSQKTKASVSSTKIQRRVPPPLTPSLRTSGEFRGGQVDPEVNTRVQRRFAGFPPAAVAR